MMRSAAQIHMAHSASSAMEEFDHDDALTAFLQPSCAGAIWRRQTPLDVQRWLDGLDPEHLPRGRVILRPEAVSESLQHLFDMYRLPDGDDRTWLHEDIVELATSFSDLLGALYIRMRLDVVTTNACRKFHVDAVTYRLVCTYRGTGTQYGIASAGNDPTQIFTAQTGAPILLKGTLAAGPAAGLLHRSPPIEGTGETRLVLVLDPVTDPQGEV